MYRGTAREAEGARSLSRPWTRPRTASACPPPYNSSRFCSDPVQHRESTDKERLSPLCTLIPSGSHALPFPFPFADSSRATSAPSSKHERSRSSGPAARLRRCDNSGPAALLGYIHHKSPHLPFSSSSAGALRPFLQRDGARSAGSRVHPVAHLGYLPLRLPTIELQPQITSSWHHFAQPQSRSPALAHRIQLGFLLARRIHRRSLLSRLAFETRRLWQRHQATRAGHSEILGNGRSQLVGQQGGSAIAAAAERCWSVSVDSGWQTDDPPAEVDESVVGNE